MTETIFFMVLGDGSGSTHIRHDTLDKARTEAERLARLNPGTKFYVLASLGHAVRNDPVVWEQHDDIPF